MFFYIFRNVYNRHLFHAKKAENVFVRFQRISDFSRCSGMEKNFPRKVDKKHENRLKVQGITHSSARVPFINYSMFLSAALRRLYKKVEREATIKKKL